MTLWHIQRGVEEQTKAFLRGFNEVVPLNWLQFFDEKELELMLCGMQELNVNEWERHTVYRNYTQQQGLHTLVAASCVAFFPYSMKFAYCRQQTL